VRNVSKIFLVLFSIVALLPSLEGSSLEVTYIANEGFLISSGTKSVLIDALFNDPQIDFCDLPPASVLHEMEQAQGVFREVDLVLVTHDHLDHFSAGSVANHLRNNAHCVLICPSQAAGRLRQECPDYDEIAARVNEVSIEPHSARKFHVDGIDVEAHRMHHCRYMESDPLTGEKRNRHAAVENLVYVVHMDGGSFLHMGDAVLELNKDYVQSLGLERRPVTAAFVEYFDSSPASGRIIDSHIDPEHLLFMHMPSEKERAKKIGAALAQAYPDAIVFQKSMEKVTLRSDPLKIGDVLHRVRQAIGHEKIAPGGKHVTIRSRGRRPAGSESVVETTFAADGRFLQQISGPQPRICGFDGTTPWIDSMGTTRTLTLSERESNLVGMWLRTGYWLHPEAPLELSLERCDDRDGALRIGMRLEEGIVSWVIEIDRSTWLPRSASKTVVGRETVIVFDEYVDHNGWKVPRHTTVRSYGRTAWEAFTESVAAARSFADSGYTPRLGPPRDTRFDYSLPATLVVKRAARGSRLLVHPLINGKDVGWLLFDTGAAGWTLSTAAADAAGLEIIGASPTTGVAGVTIESTIRLAPTIRLGPATFDDQIVRVTDSAGLGEDCVGLVGFGLFARCVVEYDDEAGLVAIHDPARYEPQGLFWEKLVPGQIVPTMEARFEGHRELFRIDTGANSALVFNTPCVKRLGLLDGRETHSIEAGGIDGTFIIERGEIDWIEFGGRRFDAVEAEFSTRKAGVLADPFTAGIICNELLKSFRIVLDYPKDRIGFAARE